MDQNLRDVRVIGGRLFKKLALGGAAMLRANADEVNKLNVFPVPDGDTGDNMRMTIEGGVSRLSKTDSDSLGEVLKTMSQGMLLGARGNSGVILSQFFAGIAEGVGENENSDIVSLGEALKTGVKTAYSAVMTPTEGTILTVARESVEYAGGRINGETTLGKLLDDLVAGMRESLAHTPDLLPVLKEAGVIDSGGAGLLYIFEGFVKVINGEEIGVEAIEEARPASNADVDISSFGPDSEMTYGYCTELLLQLQNAKCDINSFDYKVISDYLTSIGGNSIVIFRTGSIIKLHVHTLTPEKVLAFCRQFGEFLTLKIENMSVQHHESITEEAKKTEKKKYGSVAVCSGDGVKQAFTDIGVDVIVDGGQTSNPSTNDFIEAFEKVAAETIFVFPNNGNIIMAAKQAASIYGDAEIVVIESKDIGMGYVALSYIDPSEETEALVNQMNDAMKSVTTGMISPSIRDANIGGVEIRKGDYIGFVGKTMMVSEKSKTNAANSLVDMIFDDGEKFMLTVFFGKDLTEDEKKSFKAFLNQNHPKIEAYFIEGKQDVYPFVLVAE